MIDLISTDAFRSTTMESFDFHLRTRIVFGPDKVDTLGELAAELGGRRALLVTDPGIIGAGHAARAISSLEKAGLEVQVFSGVIENPTTETVDAGLVEAKNYKPDLLVGLGGGSSMDCAKGINFLYTNGGNMKDYWGVGLASKEMLPMIAVPTTAGTGSETQSFALISDAETHAKMACGDVKAACAVALLDPTLAVTMPPEVAAVTGIDAISHALETYVTKRRNPISQLFSRRAWMLLAENFERMFREPENVEVRGAMLLGASFAGLAIENSMLGATHACANPMTAHFGTTHGRAIGIMLPHVIRRNAEQMSRCYGELIEDFRGTAVANGSAGGELGKVVEGFVQTAGLPRRIRDLEVDSHGFEAMSREAAEQWTGKFNPIELTAEDYLELYQCAY